MKNFMELIKKSLQEKLVDKHLTITADVIVKNNGVKYHSISIKNEGSNVAPCIYLDEFYKKYNDNEISIEEVIENVLRVYEDAKIDHWDTDFVSDYTLACTRICGHLINAEENEEILKWHPHRRIEDLAVIYIVRIDDHKDYVTSTKVTNAMLEAWDISEEELHNQMIDNMKYDAEGEFKSLFEALEEFVDTPEELRDVRPPFYVVSNSKGIYGAIQVLDDQFMEKIYQDIGNFYIIPSSVHEVLLVPKSSSMEPQQLIASINEVNNECVNKQDILSYHLYEYDVEEKSIKIVHEEG